MATLSINNVSKTYHNGHKALTNICLDAADGEFIVIVGPSGCGKTTLLRIISGLEDLTEGEILMDGVKVNDVPPKKREISMVSQNFSLFPNMSLYKNIAFPLIISAEKSQIIKEKVTEVSRLLGLTHLQERKPSQLSGGEKQRTALGRAIIRHPKLFLFDEPLSGLDAGLRQDIRQEIAKIQRYLKTTTIYVTHDQDEAMSLADRVIVMKDGLILQSGKPMTLYSRPNSLFVANFTGKLNTLRGIFSNLDGQLVFFPVEMNNGNEALFKEPSQHLTGVNGLSVNKEVTLAFRPEDLTVRKPLRQGSHISFTALVSSIEYKGYEKIALIKPCIVKHHEINDIYSCILFMRLSQDQYIERESLITVYMYIDRLSIF